MSWLFEEPLLIVITGLVASGIVGFFWSQTGRRSLLYLLLACILATVLLLGIERLVKTDREQISVLLHDVARLVENDQLSEALRYIHASRDDIRRRAEQRLSGLRFERISIKHNLEVELITDGEPKRAVARFNAVAVLAEDVSFVKAHRPIPRFVEVELLKERDEWRVTDYSDREPMAGFLAEP